MSPTIYLACFGALLLAGVIWTIKNILSASTHPLNKVPGPWYARWTNLRLKLAVITGQRIYYVQSLHDKYGPYVRLSPTEISVADPQAFTQIHRIGSGFTKSQWYQDLVFFPRPTLFTMNDAREHATRRRLLARAFSKTYLRQNWELVVRQKVQMAVSRMKDGARSGTVDVLKWWTLMATDVSTHLMFGDSFHMIEKGETTQYIRVLQSALQGGGIGAELPIFRTIANILPIPLFQRLFNSGPYLLEYAKLAVTNSKAQGEGTNIFANIIREAEKGEHLEDFDVQLEASALIVAGSDTTAITLTYLTWAVLSRPALRDELEQEVALLPEDFGDGDIEDLPLLNAVVEETLRLYGAAPGGLPRMVPPAGTTLGGYFFPPGTTVTTQSYTLHRDPRLFPNPFEFDHTRWLSSPKSKASAGDNDLAKSIYSPFGAGSRICLGIHLARMELRLGAAEFFRRCKNARLAPSTTTESMEMENFFLIAPQGHQCEITIGD